ncbi:NAD(P)-binding protein [Thozetella sp. PMI_491]|nr:NAD(P)-binding protein [Thozetella sp. PMI_491]
MSVVAVAGGTGSIGRTVVEEIVADGKFEVIVLSRKADPELEKTIGARIIPVDYSNAASLAKLLEDNHVGTVISALGGLDSLEKERILIQSAEISRVTKRYIPNNWGNEYGPEHAWFPLAAAKIAVVEELKSTQLEWTMVVNGVFLDYWGMPKIKTYLNPFTMVLDIPGKKAAIPGTGGKPVVFTYTGDVGRFTAKLVTLGKWSPSSYIVGDTLSWEEFVKLSQEITGEEFEVVHDSVDLLKSGKVTELPSHVYAYQFFPKEALQRLLSQFGLVFEQGVFDGQSKQTLNSLFPEIKAKSARDVLEIGWKR